MFKRMYDSLSIGVHLELLVRDDAICLKLWHPITEAEFNASDAEGTFFDQSLKLASVPEYGEFPGDTSGVFHTRLPSVTMLGKKVAGDTLLPHIPEDIRATYAEKLEDKYFRNTGYTWIDPTDPSISAGEKADMACWVIGVQVAGSLVASFNALASSYNNKAHPLRSARQYGAPAALFVYKLFQSDKFTDCSLTMKYNRGCGFSTNIVDDWAVGTDDKELFKTSGSGYNYIGHMNEAFPHFEITSGGGAIDADATDTVNFKMIDNDDTLIEKTSEAYLESTGGYLPKTRVPITDGLGSFKVTALGLESGDAFKVKIGFRNLTGMHDVSYTVS